MNFTKIAALALVIFAASPAAAYVKTYRVDSPDAGAILASLESATGLTFAATCATCSVNGNLMTARGQVRVEVYESRFSPRIIPVVVTNALKQQIDDIMATFQP